MDPKMIALKERFSGGESDDAYRLLGAHALPEGGYVFRVWAPRAKAVSLVGDFNFWNTKEIPMEMDPHGIWEARSRFAKKGDRYQFYVVHRDGAAVYKSDPYARRFAPLPDKASVIWDSDDFTWTDDDWIKGRAKSDPFCKPVNIYEVHLGSWMRHPDGRFYTYEETAARLIPYLKRMGYTHVEFMPLTEYPFEGSWGYQVTGYFAPTHRYGTPEGLMRLIDACHAAGIGVILDWVPAHFPKDESGLYEFDGTPCYELSDPRMNEHREWNTRIFDFGRLEVISFLISSAVFWLREYHVDGIRVDAVASMLYLDYCRKDYVPNRFGGNYNLEAIEFLRKLNEHAFLACPGIMMIAEESTAFPMITKPGYDGGLGFNYKWNMGWMNDILDYFETDPLFRKGKHDRLTFSLTYAFSENFILPISHDEVVHGKKSLVDKMPGNYEEKFAALRTFLAYMFCHPGKKLNFMGSEFAQFIEWDYQKELDWFLLGFESHRQTQDFVRELNHFYLDHPSLWDNESGWEGFSWISADDCDNSVAAFRRISKSGDELICVFNFCPVLRRDYRLGLPEAGTYQAVFSTDRKRFGGSSTRLGPVIAKNKPFHGLPYSGVFTLPPLSATFYHIRNRIQ